MNKTALIDADSVIYIVAWNNKEHDLIDPVLNDVDEFMNSILQATEASSYLGVFSDKVTFRHKKYPTYKSSRPETPEWVVKFKSHIIEHCEKSHGFITAPGIEADDVLSIMRGPDMVYCSPDKDLKQIPGLHYDYKKNIFVEVSEEEALRLFWKQVLMGDSTDSIPGCWKVGPKTADKILDQVTHPDMYYPEVWAKYLDTYKNHELAKAKLDETIELITLTEPTPELIEQYSSYIQIPKESDPLSDLLNG